MRFAGNKDVTLEEGVEGDLVAGRQDRSDGAPPRNAGPAHADAHVVRALICLSLSLAGCSSKTTIPSTEIATMSTRGALGAPCRHDLDCIAGAACAYYTCDFVDPCSAEVTLGDMRTTRTYHYDSAGRRLGWTETDGRKERGRLTSTWSDDGRVQISELLLEGGTRVSSRQYNDERGLAAELREESAGGSRTTTYQWSDRWECRAPVMEARDGDELVYRTRPTCNPDGSPSRVDYVSSRGNAVGMSVEYQYRDGRMTERIMRYPEGAPMTFARLELVRDARGVVIETRRKTDVKDGTTQVEVYDLSCWVVDGDRVVYRPLK